MLEQNRLVKQNRVMDDKMKLGGKTVVKQRGKIGIRYEGEPMQGSQGNRDAHFHLPGLQGHKSEPFYVHLVRELPHSWK